MTRIFIAACACAISFSASLVFAQDTRPAPAGAVAARPAASGTQVALIDIGYIFRKHPGYVAKRESLVEQAKTLSTGETATKKKLQTESEKLKDFQLGSLEYKRLEAQLTQQASDLQVQAQLARRELAEEEVKLYYETYIEVQKVIDRLAGVYGIQLVIRFDREEMDAADPDSIRRGLMNPVVYQKGLDITDLVMKELSVPVADQGRRQPLR